MMETKSQFRSGDIYMCKVMQTSYCRSVKSPGTIPGTRIFGPTDEEVLHSQLGQIREEFLEKVNFEIWLGCCNINKGGEHNEKIELPMQKKHEREKEMEPANILIWLYCKMCV